jgi:hypothetical protein
MQHILNMRIIKLTAKMLPVHMCTLRAEAGDTMSWFFQSYAKLAAEKAAARVRCRGCELQNDLDACFCKRCGLGMPDGMDDLIEFKSFNFSGRDTGYKWKWLLENVSARIIGEVVALVVWDNYNITGLLIKDGKSLEVNANCSLEIPQDW